MRPDLVCNAVLKTIASWVNHYGLSSTLKNQRVWLFASLLFAMLYGILFWRLVFEQPYAIQDDARQHVFWMWRYVDPGLFPGDLVADYFQSVAPIGYKAIYRLAAWVGIHPLTFHKLLPPLICLLGTVYTFYLALAVIPVPLIAFINTLILNQALWMWDELPSGTPKAFSVLLILALLFYVSRRSLVGCAVVICLQGLFYPHLVFISVLLLALRIVWSQGSKGHHFRLFIVGAIVAVLVLLPYVLVTSPYGPVVTLEQAKTMAEFQPGGRNSYFHDDWVRYWLFSGRSGLLPPVVPTTICFSLLFPLLQWLKLPLLKKITRHGTLIVQFGIVSFVLFLLSHGVLFRLHLPSRYSRHSLKVIVAIASAVVLIALLDWGLQRLNRAPQQIWKQLVAIAMVAGVAMITVGYPLLLNSFLNVLYIKSDRVVLYEYIQQQSKDTLIASLAKEAENIPAFTGRSVLLSRGHSLAYHQGYYRQIRQRILDLIRAQYSPDLSVLQSVINDYGIDFWLVDEQSFNPDDMPGMWLRQFDAEWTVAITQLRAQPSALQRLQQDCAVVSDQGKTMISAACLLAAKG